MPLSTKRQFSLKLSSNEWLSLLAVVLVTIILGVNLTKVIARAGDNYQVYLSEKSALGGLQQEKNRLQRELAYYKSPEYKKLYARDNLHMAEPGERIIQIIDQSTVYDETSEKIDLLSTTADNSVWWEMLL